jgi:hypothetical protein
MTDDLQERVYHNLDNALKNDAFQPGGGLYGYGILQIARDMVHGAEDVEDEAPMALVPHIKSWLELHAKEITLRPN